MTSMIFPVFFQVLLTFMIMFTMGFMRFRSVKQRTVNPKDYVLMTGQEKWPEMIQRVSRSFHNQLEVPLLFYVLVAMVLITGVNMPLMVTLSWVYVGLRYVHALVHLSYNNVLHRFGVFVISCLLLLVMWVLFMLELNSSL